MGVVAEAVRTIKGNASALHMFRRREGVSVLGNTGCCVRQGTEGRCLHENQRQRKCLRESEWVGGWSPESGNETKELYMAVKERVCMKGTGSRECFREAPREEMRSRTSVCGIEMDTVPAPCSQTGRSIPDALTAFCNCMDNTILTLTIIQNRLLRWKNYFVTGCKCRSSSRFVYPHKYINTLSFQNSLGEQGDF